MKSSPLIELTGLWAANKGAELMAHAAMEAVSARIPAARFASAPVGLYRDRARLGLLQRVNRPISALSALSAREARRNEQKYGLVRSRDVTHVIDMHGFVYGDFWGARRARKAAAPAMSTRRPLYLVAQAFGPFTDAKLGAEMRKICEYARFVGARDAQSFEHLRAVSNASAIERTPDITFGVDVSDRAEWILPRAGLQELVDRPFVTIIPNRKMIESKTVDKGAYLRFLESIGGVARENGLEILILVMERDQDAKLISALSERLEARACQLDDARDVKAVISRAALNVTSRFHGLVNGLSSAVPTFAIGWSHKYSELLKDFGCPDFSLSPDAPDEGGERVRVLASDAGRRAEVSASLREVRAEMARRAGAAWDKICHDILKTV